MYIGPIFDDFLSGPKNENKLKKGGGGVKRETPPVGSAEEPGSPKSFWSLQSQKNSSEFAMNLGRPVPCEQGAADLWATASSADLRIFVCLSEVLDMSLWFCVWGSGLWFCVLCLRGLKVCLDSLG